MSFSFSFPATLASTEHFAHPHLVPSLISIAQSTANLVKRYHPVRFEGLEHLPDGPALLVGNHGRLGYETLLFFNEILARSGRHPLGLADRWFFRVPLLRDVLVRIGGIYGNCDNAVRELKQGNLVVCYPGGAREVLKSQPNDRYRLQWEQSQGFVRVALQAGVPVIPFAAAGVDDTYDVLAVLRGSGQRMMGHSKYDLPLLWARGPLPHPVPFWFRLGRPIQLDGHADDEATVHRHHHSIWGQSQEMLDDLVHEWNLHKEGTPRVELPEEAPCAS